MDIVDPCNYFCQVMRFRQILVRLLLPLLLLSGCGTRTPERTPQLNLYLHIPQPALTRADEGMVPSETASEYAIHTLQIWVFLSEACAGHPAGYCLGYLTPEAQNVASGKESQYAIPLEGAVADAHPDVDVYVLANAAAIGATDLNGSTSRAVLENLVMDQSTFGLLGTTPVHTSVPEEGLPFSGVGKNMKMKGSYPVLSLDVVTVCRAVSKLRFVFSQLVDEEGPFSNCSITGVRVDGGKISGAEYLFNDSDNSYKIYPNYYESSSIQFPALAASGIAGNMKPEEYAFDGQSAREYEALIQGGIQAGVLSSYGLCYLRETDRKLSGRIDYQIEGIPGHVDFEMKDPGDFARNHSWIVYLYFTRDAIQFTVSWTLWEEGRDFVLTN